MDASKPVGIGIAGVGGYAATIANLVLEAGGATDPPARLVAVCDPDLAAHARRVADLRDQGVRPLPRFDDLLALPEVEAVWLPLPIHLHRSFTERALAAGKAVMVEKPAAGAVEDVDAMIAARDRAGLPVALGFQDVYDATTLPLKKRILRGEFGRITHVTLHACWSRNDRYFGRSAWAGRIRVDDTWVLDSPANNALAHFIHIAQFLLGPTLHEAAGVEHVEAELYRAALIENYDTISARVRLTGGCEFLILLTHACTGTTQPILTFHGERATLTRTNSRVLIGDGDRAEAVERDGAMRSHMVQRFARLVRGVPDDEYAVATLEMARQHTVLINTVSETAPIFDIPEASIVSVTGDDGGTVRAVPDIERHVAACAERRQLLHESGLFDWTRPPSSRRIGDYRRFAGPPTRHEPTSACCRPD